MGLVIACRKHDPKRPDAGPFSKYAVRTMRRRLQDWLHRLPVVHRQVRDYSEPPRRVPLASPRVVRQMMAEEHPEEGVFCQELRVAVARLPAQQREAVASYFGLDDAPEMTALAKERGLSRQAVYRRKDAGLRELRQNLS